MFTFFNQQFSFCISVVSQQLNLALVFVGDGFGLIHVNVINLTLPYIYQHLTLHLLGVVETFVVFVQQSHVVYFYSCCENVSLCYSDTEMCRFWKMTKTGL